MSGRSYKPHKSPEFTLGITDSDDEIIFVDDLPDLVIDDRIIRGDDYFHKPDIPKMVDEMSYDLTGLGLEELVFDITKDLKVIPDSKLKDVEEICHMCDDDYFKVIVEIITDYSQDKVVEKYDKEICQYDYECLFAQIFREIYFAAMKKAHMHGNTGIVPRILSELPERLKM